MTGRAGGAPHGESLCSATVWRAAAAPSLSLTGCWSKTEALLFVSRKIHETMEFFSVRDELSDACVSTVTESKSV